MNADTWLERVAITFSALKAGTTSSTDLIILLNHIGNHDSATSPFYELYVERVCPLAEAYGAAVVNIWRLGRNLTAYWSTLGYWGTPDGSGGSSSPDYIHPSDAGHAYIASVLQPIITASERAVRA